MGRRRHSGITRSRCCESVLIMAEIGQIVSGIPDLDADKHSVELALDSLIILC